VGWAYDKVYEGPRQPAPSLDEMAKVQEEYEKPMVEAVAKAIYEEETSEWKEIYGKIPRIWRIQDTPWDSNDNELCEHERDDYRMMARAAIKAMRIYQQKEKEGI